MRVARGSERRESAGMIAGGVCASSRMGGWRMVGCARGGRGYVLWGLRIGSLPSLSLSPSLRRTVRRFTSLFLLSLAVFLLLSLFLPCPPSLPPPPPSSLASPPPFHPPPPRASHPFFLPLSLSEKIREGEGGRERQSQGEWEREEGGKETARVSKDVSESLL